MSIKAPPPVASVQHLISRGEEILSMDPIVAYFCYYYAVRQVLETKLHSSDPTVAEFATALLNRIETLKGSCSDQELLNDDDASRAHVHNFASAVFERVDQATRCQRVTKATGAGFAAAATFLGLEGIWGEIDSETKMKIKFSKFQATRILKTIKDGGNPNDLFIPVLEEAGESAENPRDEKEQQLNLQESHITSSAEDIPDSSNTYGSKDCIELPAPPRVDSKDDMPLSHAPKESLADDLLLPPPPESKPEGNVFPPPPPPKQPTSSEESRKSDHNESIRLPEPAKSTEQPDSPVKAPKCSSSISPQELIALTKVTSSAQKHTKYALSALNYDDIDTAISELEKSLNLLRLHQSKCLRKP